MFDLYLTEPFVPFTIALALLLGLLVLELFLALLGGTLLGLGADADLDVDMDIDAPDLGEVFARLLPKTETTAMSERHLGRRIGVVSQGTAKRGMPAEVRVTDHHGNMHYLRAEPVRDSDEIPQGSRVLVLRHRFDQGYRITALGPEA